MAISDKIMTSTKQGRKTKKTNLTKLCSEMTKLSSDAVDKEIIKRFKVVIDASDDDLAKTSIDKIINKAETVDLNDYHEGIQPYIKHYLFMIKRSNRNKAKETEA